MCPNTASVRRNIHAPSRRLHQHNRTTLVGHAHVTTCLCLYSQTAKYATHSSQHPSCSRGSVCPYRAPSLAPDACSSLVPRPLPMPRSYGCSVGSLRDDAAEGGRRRDANTRSTFETSKYNGCNIRLKVVETLETCLWNTWKTHLKTIATHTQHPNKTYTTYVWNICNRRCLMTGNSSRGYPDDDWWASAYAELDGKRRGSDLYWFRPLRSVIL
jgi:hypothetical protein